LPSPFYHKSLSEVRHCRLCVIGARRKSTDEFSEVFVCTATAKDDMEVNIEYGKVITKHNELLMSHLMQHPLDCSKCNKVGYCFLHQFATQKGFHGFTRFADRQLKDVEYRNFGQDIIFDVQKCIGCQRCIRSYRDFLGEELIGFIRNDKRYKKAFLCPSKTLDNSYSLNFVDLSSVGAFVDKNSVYQPAECNLIKTPSISTESNVGINTYVFHKKIFLEPNRVKTNM
jgi:NADH-quinone oxidoreductase subunit G